MGTGLAGPGAVAAAALLLVALAGAGPAWLAGSAERVCLPLLAGRAMAGGAWLNSCVWVAPLVAAAAC